jgi:hypothetical protein
MRRNRRSGQSLIETSLVIIALLLIVVAILDFGQFLFYFQVLTDRARAGARYAVTNTYDELAIKNVVVFDNPAGNGSETVGLFGIDRDTHVSVHPTPSTGTPTRIEVRISNFPIYFLSPYLYKNNVTMRPVRAVRQAEGLGATN